MTQHFTHSALSKLFASSLVVVCLLSAAFVSRPTLFSSPAAARGGADPAKPILAPQVKGSDAAPAGIRSVATRSQPLPGRDESGTKAQAQVAIEPSQDSPPCYELTANIFGNLVEWLRFNENAGDDAFDSSSFTNHGKLKPNAAAGPTRVTGKVGNALQFDGVNDSVEAFDSNSLDIGTGSLTVDAWIKPTSASTGLGSGIRPIVDKRTGTGGPNPLRQAQQDTATGYALFLVDGKLSFQLGSGAYYNYVSMADIPPDDWTHVTAVATRTTLGFKVEMFVNGASVYTNTTNPITGDISNTAPLWVGRRHPLPIASDERHFVGLIDEVEIFNRALTPGEISGIVAAGSKGKCKCVEPPKPDKLVAWWSLDGNGDDYWGGHHGQVAGLGGTFPPAMVDKGWKSGPLASLIEVPGHPDLDVTSFTIDAWVKIDGFTTNNMPIVYKGDASAAGVSTAFALGVTGTSASTSPAGRLLAIISDGGPALEVFSTDLLPIGVFMHVAATAAVTASGGTQVCVYIDGIKKNCASANFKAQNTQDPIQIGGVSGQTGNPVNYFNGIIDEVELWNEALTEEEIRSIFLAWTAGKCKPSAGCCGGRKPRFPDFPGVAEATYSTFSDQVAVATCYSPAPPLGQGNQGPVLVVVDLKNQANAPIDQNWTTASTSPPPRRSITIPIGRARSWATSLA